MNAFLKFVFAATILFSLSHRALAQFDDSEDSTEESSGKKKSDEATKELPQVKSEKEDLAFDDSSASKNVEVTKAEREDLATAFKKKSDSAIVKAASVILSKDPSNLEALNAMAVHYFEERKYGISKIILKRAMKDHPKESAIANNLGIIYLAEGEVQLAIEQFRKSLANHSDYRFGATNLSSIYLEYLDYKRSISPLEESYKAVHSDVSRGDVHAIEIANNYGVALMGIGDYSKAESVLSEIAASNSRNAVPLLNYAILLVEVQKKKKDAIRVISKLKFMTDDRDILRRAEELENKLE